MLLIAVLFLGHLCFAMDTVVPNELIQAIIDHPSLSPYWHKEVEGRVPLRILHDCVGTLKGIKKFNQDVVLIKKPDGFPYFQIDSFEIKEGNWIVRIKYPIEGLGGIFIAKLLKNREWEITSAQVYEE